MKKTKLEEYVNSNGLLCEINIDIDGAYCSLFKKDDLYISFYSAKTLNSAIEKAVNAHRERGFNDNRSKQEIQNEKRARMLHQRFSNKKRGK